MTYKAAVAGLNLGGGKAVIIGDSKTDKSELLFRTFGKFVDGLGGRFIAAEDVEKRKPAPDIFLAAAGKIDVPASECAVIEDSVSGLEAAKAAEMKCIAVAQTFPAGKLEQADLVFDSIKEVAISSIEEL